MASLLVDGFWAQSKVRHHISYCTLDSSIFKASFIDIVAIDETCAIFIEAF